MDGYLKLNIIKLLKHITSLNVSSDLKKQIDELYDRFECCDFDLYNYNVKNEYENKIKKIIEFYYDNIERVINDFSNDQAIQFIYKLKKLCLVNFDEIISYLG